MIIKICGMREIDNIREVEQLEVDWMGFIFYPSSPRYVSERPAYLPRKQKRVGVFVNAEKSFILEHVKLFHLDLLQLHGNETPSYCSEIRKVAHIPIIKAFSIGEKTNFTTLCTYEEHIDYFLFDTPCSTVGGSGKPFDHSRLNDYQGHTPFLLSGGLGPDDAEEIHEFKHPAFAGIDLNSRFELRPALKSVEKLHSFLLKIKNSKTLTK